MSKVLIELDNGFMGRIERERFVAEYASAAAIIETTGKPGKGKRPHRTGMMRTLLREAMDARCLARGEAIPTAEELAALNVEVVDQAEPVATESVSEAASEFVPETVIVTVD